MKIFFLVDYKNTFGSKFGAVPYRSGLDQELLKSEFNKRNVDVQFLHFYDIDLRTMNFKNEYIMYSSSEDIDYFYKSYIEDICYALHLQGAILIPDYKFLKAHSNKVFMELVRDLAEINSIKNIRSKYYGTLEEIQENIDTVSLPSVVKGAGGAKSSNVTLAEDIVDLLQKVKKISGTQNFYYDLWDFIRSLKHPGYIRESRHRRKFIVQNFISGMDGDWKVLAFNNFFFVLKRKVRKNDFRASGSGIFFFDEKINSELLDFAEEIVQKMGVPFLSMDVGCVNSKFCLLEFQALYFGTYTMEKSKKLFKKENGQWVTSDNNYSLEKMYTESTLSFIDRMKEQKPGNLSLQQKSAGHNALQ